MHEPLRYDSPAALAEFLKTHSLAMNKMYGQNFLINRAVRERIVNELHLDTPGLRVWEIGPGLGAMTVLLLQEAVSLTAFEIDHGFCTVLRSILDDESRFSLVEGDFLKTWITIKQTRGIPDRVMGNLPYNVGAVMIGSLLEQEVLPEIMVFMLQKEAAERITAQPGTGSYSAFSLLCQLDYSSKIVGVIKPGSFFPRPDVVSAIVRMERKQHPGIDSELRSLYRLVIHDLFRSRRKSIRNALHMGQVGKILTKEAVSAVLDKAGIDPACRGESLTVSDSILLTRLINVRRED